MVLTALRRALLGTSLWRLEPCALRRADLRAYFRRVTSSPLLGYEVGPVQIGLVRGPEEIVRGVVGFAVVTMLDQFRPLRRETVEGECDKAVNLYGLVMRARAVREDGDVGQLVAVLVVPLRKHVARVDLATLRADVSDAPKRRCLDMLKRGHSSPFLDRVAGAIQFCHLWLSFELLRRFAFGDACGACRFVGGCERHALTCSALPTPAPPTTTAKGTVAHAHRQARPQTATNMDGVSAVRSEVLWVVGSGEGKEGLNVTGQDEVQRVAVLEDAGIGRRAAVKPMERQASISAVWREERRALLWAAAPDVGY